MTRKRILLELDVETVRLLETMTTPRRKSQFLTKLIRQAAEEEPMPLLLQRMEERLKRIEEKLDRLNATGP